MASLVNSSRFSLIQFTRQGARSSVGYIRTSSVHPFQSPLSLNGPFHDCHLHSQVALVSLHVGYFCIFGLGIVEPILRLDIVILRNQISAALKTISDSLKSPASLTRYQPHQFKYTGIFGGGPPQGALTQFHAQ
jgi:hypothetical protein